MGLKSAIEVKAELSRSGVSAAQWALANGLNVMIVYGLLSGRRKGTRGEAHRAAVLLGLKTGRILPAAAVKDALVPENTRKSA